MAFPPPTDGYVESPIAQTLEDYLTPIKSAIHTMLAKENLMIKHISKGDAVTIQLGSNPHDGCVGLVKYEGDAFLSVLNWRRGRWFAQTADRRGTVTEEMRLTGIASALLKNHLS